MDILPIITAALSLVSTIAPIVTSSDQVQKIIDVAEKVVDQAGPAITAGVNFVEDVAPNISAAFDILRSKGATTPAQLEQMDAIEAKLDSDFDTADDAAKAEDAAADASQTKPAT